MTEFQFQFGDDGPSLEAAVFQALGAASVAWHPDGVFDDRFARDIGEKLLGFIRGRTE